MARRHNKEVGDHLEQEGNRRKAMEGIDGGLHPAVDGQSLDKGSRYNFADRSTPEIQVICFGNAKQPTQNNSQTNHWGSAQLLYLWMCV